MLLCELLYQLACNFAYLLAAKYCEIPALKTGPSQSCKQAKIVASTLIFEGGPECIHSNRAWYHPDMVVGQCIDIIGDRNVHVPGKRVLKNKSPIPELARSKSDVYKSGGMRADPEMHTNGIYPLFNAVDFRFEGHRSAPQQKMPGGYGWDSRHPAQPNGYTGFHFHNCFDDMVQYEENTTRMATQTNKQTAIETLFQNRLGRFQPA